MIMSNSIKFISDLIFMSTGENTAVKTVKSWNDPRIWQTVLF